MQLCEKITLKDGEPHGDCGRACKECGDRDGCDEFASFGKQQESVSVITEVVALTEKARRDGTVPVKVIRPGWGSSGYYKADVLARDFPVFEGAKMFWDHPTPSQDRDRPERSLNDLAGVLSNVHFAEQGFDGPGIYGDAKVFSPFKDRLEEMAPHIGISILANGQVTKGEVEGKKGHIVEAITSARSVDFVTTAGAGGKVVQLFESLSGTGTGPAEGVKEDMEKLEEVQAKLAEAEAKLAESEANLAEANEYAAKLELQVARAREAEVITAAKDIAVAMLSESKLPEVTQTRLVESLTVDPPITDELALDESAFKDTVEKAIADEADYIAKISARTTGHIKGLGESGPTGDEGDDPTPVLEEAFKALGLSESEAKHAATGR